MTPKVNVKRSPGQKCDFKSHLTVLELMFMVKGHMGQGQRSHGSMSKVAWIKPRLKVLILAGGLTSTSSCLIFYRTFSSALWLNL